MPSLIFRGAHIRYADLHTEEAGVYARLRLQSDLSGPVAEAMGWGEIPEGVTAAKLSGKLSGHHLTLTPAGELARHEVQFDCGDVSDFALAAEKDDDGELTGFRLNFIARTQQTGAIALVENYLRLVGDAPASCKVAYEKQGELGLEPQEDTNEVEKADADYSLDDSSAAPLASAVEVAGNTDKLKRQRRARRPNVDPIPTQPGPEWRVNEEIVEGVPHHVEPTAEIA